MPIYEFYCVDCHTVFSFLSRTAETRGRPDCPRCGRSDLDRRPSAFAISRGRKEPDAPPVEPGFDESRLERVMESMAHELDSIDENDPRQAATVMRRLYEAAGLPVAGGMAEALRRMEQGEDPEKIEAEMGDVFEGDDPLAAGAGEPGRGLKAIRRKLLPPAVDSELHEM